MFFRLLLLFHLLDVGARCKRLFAACDDDAPDAVVQVEVVERGHQVSHQGVGKRVKRLWGREQR
jgi:tRNA(Ser,Leu) C12 N-acetylase TAN1